ncbi:MAG: SRPBCC domain-containing protein [Cyclobacteriaceae bacterium]
MINLYKTEIRKDASECKLYITRKFAAPLDMVWRAWTEPELLDQWWAPRPYQTRTKSMDFSEGGCWLYSMNGPEGDAHWCRADYITIVNNDHYTAKDAFCDEDGLINEAHPRMLWKNRFESDGDQTRVVVEVTFNNVEEIEKIIEMGFKEGFTAAHDNLDELLTALEQKD